jgi:formylglycine-generating enzyme required for sulfatase activity
MVLRVPRGAATLHSWGDELDDRHVWHRGNSPRGTHPVGRTIPNPWGLYDMVVQRLGMAAA